MNKPCVPENLGALSKELQAPFAPLTFTPLVETRQPLPAPPTLTIPAKPVWIDSFFAAGNASIWVLTLLMRASFGATATYARGIVDAVWGTSYPIAFTGNSSSLTPGFFQLAFQGFDLVVISGTTTSEQWYTHIKTAPLGPVGASSWKTLQTFGDAATAIDTALTPLIPDPTRPVLLVGHSYGAAIATVLSAMFRDRDPDREIVVVTFGEPKAGDVALADLVNARVRKTRYAMDGDFVPLTPPDFGVYPVLLSPAIALLIRKCRLFTPSGAPILVRSNGLLIAQERSWQGSGDASLCWQSVLAGSVEPFSLAHTGATYSAAIRRSFGNVGDGINSGFLDPADLATQSVRLAAAGL